MAKLINGKEISQQIKDELKEKVSAWKAQGKNICLAVIQVGNDPASSVYVGNKKKACAYIGIESRAFELPEETTEEELLSIIKDLNEDDGVHGILVQLPVPKHINEEKIINAISPKKDVDGFHPESVGSLCIGRPGFVSCTPAGIIQLLKRSEIDIEGKHCVVIGRSNIVGKPMALLMLRAGLFYMTWVLKNKNLFGWFAWAVNIPLIIALIFTPTLVGKWKGMYKLNMRGYMLAVIGRALVVVAGYIGNVLQNTLRLFQ